MNAFPVFPFEPTPLYLIANVCLPSAKVSPGLYFHLAAFEILAPVPDKPATFVVFVPFKSMNSPPSIEIAALPRYFPFVCCEASTSAPTVMKRSKSPAGAVNSVVAVPLTLFHAFPLYPS